MPRYRHDEHDNEDDDDDLELQSLLSESSRDAITRSKRQIAETAQLGAEVLKNLHGDAEKIRGIRSKQDQLKRQYDQAETSLFSIERSKLAEYAFVCLALSLVAIGIIVVMVRIFSPKH